MNRCGIASVTLMRYVDGELVGARAEVVSQHVAACGACRGEVQALLRLKQRLRAQQAADHEAIGRLCAFAALLTRACR